MNCSLITQRPSLFLWAHFDLKSILSDIRIGTATYIFLLVYLPFLDPQSVGVFGSEHSSLETAGDGFLVNTFSFSASLYDAKLRLFLLKAMRRYFL